MLASEKKSPPLQGKTCLVTGAASGIGRATVELMARHGASTIPADIDFPLVTEPNSGFSNEVGGRAVRLAVGFVMTQS